MSTATREQSSGVEQVNQTLDQMSRLTQTNSQNSEKAAQVSAVLAEQAMGLNGLVAFLMNLIEGSRVSGGDGRDVRGTSTRVVADDVASLSSPAEAAWPQLEQRDR